MEFDAYASREFNIKTTILLFDIILYNVTQWIRQIFKQETYFSFGFSIDFDLKVHLKENICLFNIKFIALKIL